jgi:hypothetical protein
MSLWSCPKCRRTFRQKNQAHFCGTGDRDMMLDKKPDDLVALYLTLEKQVERWDGVEIVFKRSYALFRTTRIFADLVFMKDALRLALLLDGLVRHPLFFKSLAMSTHRVAHVAKLHTPADLRAVMPDLKEAHRHACDDMKKNS